jgi:glycogen operon protein
MTIWPGRPYPLGATWSADGTNFSVFSSAAESVELCVFDEDGRERRLTLPEVSAYHWHGFVPGVRPGQRYGYRVYGPWDPAQGARFNPRKLLVDPYAYAIDGHVQWSDAMYGHRLDDPNVADDQDSAPLVPRGVVIDPAFDWSGDVRPNVPLHETVIYELHVKGFTKRHPDIPEPLRGTYRGLAHPASLDYLTALGITAIELMPVHQFVHDAALVARGLRNYWGYNSIGYLAPHGEYASTGTRGQQVVEFKEMVRALHAVGIEVILDVVYNHTAEGNEQGPTLAFKGLDNAAYYRLDPSDRRRYVDYTGTGNTLNMRHPHVLQLMMDSLRYWVEEMHVDGFRFDLAATLARELHAVDRLSAFFDVIQQDPVIGRIKLIAEPWDVGEGGYHVGNFPALWSEWNGKFRDTVRDYWRGVDGTLGEFASRLTGSSDLYAAGGRRPSASVNFVTAHDGFTLRDLVSYTVKRNEANGEGNRDGTDDNRAWNCGVEGLTDDLDVLCLRGRQQRNLMATLLLSQGLPLLLAGDEIGRTQLGNNNTYNQDNELSWLDWLHADLGLLDFTRRVIRLCRDHPVFKRRRWFQGHPIHGSGVKDIAWYRPDGVEMADTHWAEQSVQSVAVFLNGDAIPSRGPRGEAITDDSFFLLFHAQPEATTFIVPPGLGMWLMVLATDREVDAAEPAYAAGDSLAVTGRSFVLLRRTSI